MADKERILVVDDEPSIRKYLGTLLEVDGYQVEVPDYWLDFNPWEFPRHDITVDIQFFGTVNRWQ